MGLFSREPAIKGDERQECLAYYEEEKKLRLLYERVEQLFDKRVGKYENALFQARKAKIAPMNGVFANLGKIVEVKEHISQAATEIVKRKKTDESCTLCCFSNGLCLGSCIFGL